jgi:rhomboid protease GluP
MDWNYILLWIAGSSCVINLIQAVRASPVLKGWMLVGAGILAAGAALMFLQPQVAGIVVGWLWLALILTPALLQRRVQRLMLRQQYRSAGRLAAIARWIHPFDGMWAQARLIRALNTAEHGDVDAAIEIFQQVADAAPPRVARAARVHLLRLRNEWPELVDWVQQNIPAPALRRDGSVLAIYLRALGETGQLDQMLATFDRFRAALDSPVLALPRHLCRLTAFAFAGEPHRVYTVLAGPLRVLPPVVQQFWIATAEYAAGFAHAAEGRLLTIEEVATPGMRRAIARRLERPPALASTLLSPSGQEILHRLERERDEEERYATVRTFGRRAWATHAIIGANVIMFIAEWLAGGTTNEEALLKLGAFHPDLAEHGQPWRLLTANFLHFGIPHIALNMLALLVLGPFVEFALGAGWYLAVYLVSGILAIGTVWLMQHLHRIEPDFLVGASGAIMGLIGATAAILFRGWAKERARIARRRLGMVVMILALQVVFDQLTPQVSGTAHLAGALWGFVLTSLIPHRTTRRRDTGFEVRPAERPLGVS